MAGNYVISIEPGFIRVMLPPSEHASPSQDFFTGVLDAARDAGVSKILFDVLSVTGKISVLERYNYASRIAELFRGFKVAFVVNRSLRDPNLFGQKVGVNRGAYMRVLTNLSEAYEWLEVEPADKTDGGDGK